MHRTWLFGGLMVVAMVLAVVLFRFVPSELAPAEDRGFFQVLIDGPEGAGFDYTVGQMQAGREDRRADDRRRPADHARQPARARRLRRQRGNAHRAHVGVPAGLGQARRRTPPTSPTSLQKKLSVLTGVRARTAGQRRPGAFARAAVHRRAGRAGLRGDRAVARQAAGAHGGQSRPGRSPIRTTRKRARRCAWTIDRERAADLGVSRERNRPRAGNDDGFAPGDHLRRQRRGIRRAWSRPAAKAAPRPADLEAIQVRSSNGDLVPLSNLVTLSEVAEPGRLNRFNRLRAITISRGPGARLSDGRGDRLDPAGRAPKSCPSTRRSTGRASRASTSRPAARCCFTFALALLIVLPGAGRAVRELHPSAGDHADRAAGRAGRVAGLVGHRRHAEPLQPDRHRDAGGPGGEERHPDRRVRQPAARRGPQRPPGDRRVVQRAPAPDPDDLHRHHHGRGAAGAGRRAGFGEPRHHRRGGDLRRRVLHAAVAAGGARRLYPAGALYQIARSGGTRA